ncbi:uncharacterized protein [Emydura macquarii macquarii]|uniref:uncharacterized protein n=1 Tax=Emydura macquarii macquarii TaxID=1129001 RepID=UPI00352B6F36
MVKAKILHYHENIAEQLEEIESTFQKLSLLDDKVCKCLPWSAREEIHQRLKRLTDKTAMLLKGDTESHRRSFEDLTSRTQPPESELENFLLGRQIAVETELQGQKERENISEQVAEKQETASHVIRICEKAPTPKYGLDQASLDPAIHNIRNTTKDTEHKVDIKGLRQRSEEQMSPEQAPESGLSRGEHFSTGVKLAVEESSKGNIKRGNNSEQVSEKQEEAENGDCGEAQTPKDGISQAFLDPVSHRISNTTEDAEQKRVDVKGSKERSEDLTSLKSAVESGERRKDSASPGRNAATQTELQGHEEKEGKALVEQKETKTHICEETKIPSSVVRRKHQGLRYSTVGVIRELTQIKFADDTKIGSVVNDEEDKSVIQSNMDYLKLGTSKQYEF